MNDVVLMRAAAMLMFFRCSVDELYLLLDEYEYMCVNQFISSIGLLSYK